MNFYELAKKYDTPLYVYDFDLISANYNALKQAFSGRKSLICYAVKANSNLSLLEHIASLEAGCDCVSIGEVKRALMAKISPYKIIFSGVGKTDSEIKEALESEILMLNVESEEELNRIEQIALDLGKTARISIRVNPNIDPKTHPYISTGLNENKFGVDINTAKKMYIQAKGSKNLEPIGIHFHIGSQLCELEPIKEAAVIVANLARSLKALEIDIKFFDVGGGLGIRYKDEDEIKPEDYTRAIFEALNGLDVTIICEPGRFLVANAGFFVTKVLYEKENEGKRFIIVDGAMNDFIRPSLYNAYHDAFVLDKNENAKEADVVGAICESGDFLCKNIKLPKTEHNDIIVFKSAGAYGFSMSSNYNSRLRAAEVAIKSKKDRLIRKRETYEDLFRQEQCLGGENEYR